MKPSGTVCPNCHTDCGGHFITSETGVWHCGCYEKNEAADIHVTRDLVLIQREIDKENKHLVDLEKKGQELLQSLKETRRDQLRTADAIFRAKQRFREVEAYNAHKRAKESP